MALAGALEIQIFAEIARLRSDMEKATGVVKTSMKSIEGAVGSAKTALASLGVGLGLGALIAMTKGVIDAADKFNDLTQSMGINRQELAKYQLATAQSGTTLEGLGKGIKGLTNAFAEHGDELRAAGITAKTADGQVRQLADIISKMPDGLEKTTLATKLFGKSGMELIPMLNMGAAGLDEAAAKSAKYAAVMATLAPQADQFNDTMTELGMASKVAGMAMMNDALPAMTRIAGAMAVAAHESGALMAIWVGLGGIGWEAIFKPLTALIKGTIANLEDANAAMLRFFGANEGAALASARAARIWKEVADLQSAPPAPPKKAEFDTDAWVEQYKKLVAALGLGKKATEETESAYKSMHKTLSEMLLTESERTEVNKLQLALDAMTAKKRAEFKPGEEEALKTLAQKVDLMKAEKTALDALLASEEHFAGLKKEYDAAVSNEDNARGQRILSTSTMIDQMVFETSQIGKTNVEREIAIFLRQAEIDKIDEATIARGKEAIAAKHAAEEAKSSQVSMWQSVESAGHQAFLSIFDTSKSVLERIRDMLKTHLIDILYQMTVKKWIFNIVASVSGAGVAQSAFGSTSSGLSALGGGGGILGGINTGAGLFTGALDGAFQSAGVSLGSQFIADIGNYGWGVPVASGVMMALSGNVSGGIGSTIGGIAGSYFGPIGTMVGSWLGGMIGSALGGGGGTPTSALPEFAANLQTGVDARYAAVLAALGGARTDAAFFAGANTGGGGVDPQFALTAMAGGRRYDAGGYGGAENPMNDAALELAASRAILTALQGSQLPEYLAKYLNTLTAESMDQASINNALAFAGSLKQLREQLAETRTPAEIVTAQMTSLNTALGASATTVDTWKTQFIAAIDAGIGPETLAKWQALGQAIQSATDIAAQAAADAARIAQQAADDAVRLAQQHADAVSQAQDALRSAYEREADAWRARIDQLHGIVESLQAFKDQLAVSGAGTSPFDRYSAAAAQFGDVSRRAQLGDLDAISQLQSVSEQFLAASEAFNASSPAFQADRALVLAALDAAQAVAMRQETIAERQLDRMTAQVRGLVDINSSVLSVHDAIEALREMMFPSATGSAGAGGGSVLTSGGGGGGGLREDVGKFVANQALTSLNAQGFSDVTGQSGFNLQPSAGLLYDYLNAPFGTPGAAGFLNKTQDQIIAELSLSIGTAYRRMMDVAHASDAAAIALYGPDAHAAWLPPSGMWAVRVATGLEDIQHYFDLLSLVRPSLQYQGSHPNMEPVHIPTAGFAAGGIASGLFAAGERGPELMFSSSNVRVLSNEQSKAAVIDGAELSTLLREVRDELRAANNQRGAVGVATINKLDGVADKLDSQNRIMRREAA